MKISKGFEIGSLSSEKNCFDRRIAEAAGAHKGYLEPPHGRHHQEYYEAHDVEAVRQFLAEADNVFLEMLRNHQKMALNYHSADDDAFEDQVATMDSRYRQAMLYRRNRDWLPKLEEMMGESAGYSLVISGVLHMYGDQGLLELMKQAGYKVQRVHF